MPTSLPLQWRDPPPHYPHVDSHRRRRRPVDIGRQRPEDLRAARIEASLDRIDALFSDFNRSLTASSNRLSSDIYKYSLQHAASDSASASASAPSRDPTQLSLSISPTYSSPPVTTTSTSSDGFRVVDEGKEDENDFEKRTNDFASKFKVNRFLCAVNTSLPLFSYLLIRNRGKEMRKLRLPPGSMGLPFLGETFQLYSQDPNIFFSSRLKTYGEIFKMHLLSCPCVMLASPEATRMVLVSDAHLFKPTYPRSKEQMIGSWALFFHQDDYHAGRATADGATTVIDNALAAHAARKQRAQLDRTSSGAEIGLRWLIFISTKTVNNDANSCYLQPSPVDLLPTPALGATESRFAEDWPLATIDKPFYEISGKSVAAHEYMASNDAEEEEKRLAAIELRFAEDWPRIKKKFQILRHFFDRDTAAVKGIILYESRFLELKEKLFMFSCEDYALGGIGDIFITGVPIFDVKCTDKANLTGCPLVARRNVFGQLSVENWLAKIDLIFQEYKELLMDMCEKLAPNLSYIKFLFLGWFEPFRDQIVAEKKLCQDPKCKTSHAPYFNELPSDMIAVITMLLEELKKIDDYDTAVDGFGSIREPKHGRLKELHRVIKLCKNTSDSTDPTMLSFDSYQQVYFLKKDFTITEKNMPMEPNRKEHAVWELLLNACKICGDACLGEEIGKNEVIIEVSRDDCLRTTELKAIATNAQNKIFDPGGSLWTIHLDGVKVF